MTKIRSIIAGIFAAIALAIGLFIHSQTAADTSAQVKGTAPTQNTDGTNLTDLVSIKVYHKLGAGAVSVVETIAFTTAGGQFTSTKYNSLANGVHCYNATAVRANGAESALSMPDACKTIDGSIPKAPTAVTVQ